MWVAPYNANKSKGSFDSRVWWRVIFDTIQHRVILGRKEVKANLG